MRIRTMKKGVPIACLTALVVAVGALGYRLGYTCGRDGRPRLTAATPPTFYIGTPDPGKEIEPNIIAVQMHDDEMISIVRSPTSDQLYVHPGRYPDPPTPKFVGYPKLVARPVGQGIALEVESHP